MKILLVFMVWSTVGYATDKVVKVEPVVNPWLADVWGDLIVSGPSDLIKAVVWWAVSLGAFTVYKKWLEPWVVKNK